MLSRSELDSLFRYCLALSGDNCDAEDLLHSALEAYLAQGRDHVQSPVAYIRRIARNRFYDQLRRLGSSPVTPLEDMDADMMLYADKELESVMVDDITLKQIWRTLGSAERELLFLWAVEGLSISEIALQLTVPKGTLLSRLHRLRQRILGKFDYDRATGGPQ